MRYPYFLAVAISAVVVLSGHASAQDLFPQQGLKSLLPLVQVDPHTMRCNLPPILGEELQLAQRGEVFTQQGFRSTLPLVKEVPSRPQIGPEGIDALVQLSSIDGEFEVVAAQARYLILKRDLARPDGRGKVRPLVAVGHSGVIDMDIINSRLIRVVGRRVGVTDLMIMLDDNSLYTLRVHVVYDLDTLRSRLSQQFPEAQVPLRQSRETITVSGMAPSPLDVRNVIRMIQTNTNAEQSILLGRSSGGGGPPAPAPQAAPAAPR